ncbi:hypothetical protein [Streptomyces sp. NRRL WC-3742]|nr:hypothetical protein [Streptomyces sp. NRRL WC-3742]
MKFFVGAILIALLALAIATVVLGVVATLKMPRPEERDEHH